jgi:hypothetical protein
MGFVISVLYFGIYYLSPAYVLGPLAPYHVQQILVVLALLVSVPALFKSFLFKAPQTLAMIGLACSVFLSQAIGNHYVGGGIHAFEEFVPNGMAYFLIGLHCTTKRRIQVITAMIFCVCLVIIANGYRDLRHGVVDSAPPPGIGLGNPVETGKTASPFLLRQATTPGAWTFRLQGLGEINDPNDFAQLMVCIVPLIFVFYRPKGHLPNFIFVILPICVLLFGIYLTHSRGALVALTAIIIFASRRRIGTIPALALAACLFLGAMALQFTGGRDISASAGEDRTALWGEGLAAFKSHPLFGVGFGQLYDYTDNHLTAHNSIVLCVSELGLFGMYVWSLFLFPTIRNAKVIATPGTVTDPISSEVEQLPFPRQGWHDIEAMDKNEITRLGELIFLSLVGFLIAGWFLSRAFVLTLFLLGGLAESIYQMALNRGMISPRLPFGRVLINSAGLALGLLLMIYLAVRILNFIH